MYSLAGRYDNLIPTQFLAPIDCLKIQVQGTVKKGEDSITRNLLFV
jgi:hypothetical protein